VGRWKYPWQQTLIFIGIALGLVACTPKPGGVGKLVRPAKPTIPDEGMCRAVEDFGQPLLVDWKPHQRANLEEAMIDNLAIVAYDCKSLRLLKSCRYVGKRGTKDANSNAPDGEKDKDVQGNGSNYEYIGLSRKENLIRLFDKDEVRANLPGFGGKYVLSLGAELERGASLDVALIMIGKKRTTVSSVKRKELEGDCEGASHFIRGAFVGAFAMKTGTQGKASSVASIFGAEASGASTSNQSTLNKDGNPSACNSAKSDDNNPPQECGALLRLELVAIGGATGKKKGVKKQEDSDEIGCPKGMVMSEGKCTAMAKASSYVCKSFQYDECSQQCGKGNGQSCFRLGEIYKSGKGAPKDLAKAKAAFSKACDKEVGFGCNNLGFMYNRGEGVPVDEGKAATLYEKACRFDSAKGCSNLGYMYQYGKGVSKNETTAAKYYQQGCGKGDGMGCNNLGNLTMKGAGGLEKSDDKALELFKKACAGNDRHGCTNIALFYELGKGGLARDTARAKRMYGPLCQRQVGFACYRLGRMYHSGTGVSRNVATAKDYFKQACGFKYQLGCDTYKDMSNSQAKILARQKEELKRIDGYKLDCQTGDLKACVSLGTVYRYGYADIKSDYPRAVKLYEMACKGGLSTGCYRLGQMWRDGKGVSKDMRKAISFYKKACDMSDKYACESIGLIYEYGSGGVAKNFFLANTYFVKSCNAGNSYSCYRLGSTYRLGKKVAKSTKEAIKYYKKACSFGYRRGCTAAHDLERPGAHLGNPAFRTTNPPCRFGCKGVFRFIPLSTANENVENENTSQKQTPCR
jgi:uncharacterized protein